MPARSEASGFTPGNRVELLCNGDVFFARLIEAIDAAQTWVHLETYIFADDAAGDRVADALAAAARRGVAVGLVVDGFGTGGYAQVLAARLAPAGVALRIYRPARWWWPQRRQMRRMHRKLCVIDERIAFVGGINVIDDHHHPGEDSAALGPRFDFAVAVRGPLAAAAGIAARRLWRALSLGRRSVSMDIPPPRMAPPEPGGVPARLVLRDNFRHRRSIEDAYLAAITMARADVLIACAYFLPGRRFRAALCAAARRGVRVRLLLQGRVEHAAWYWAQRALYEELLAAGVAIHLYLPSHLHAKVAVIDGDWATVGSSNIDPYSLLLAREANVVVSDAGFAQQLAAAIEAAMQRDARPVLAAEHARRPWWSRLAARLMYGFVRLATRVLVRAEPG